MTSEGSGIAEPLTGDDVDAGADSQLGPGFVGGADGGVEGEAGTVTESPADG